MLKYFTQFFQRKIVIFMSHPCKYCLLTPICDKLSYCEERESRVKQQSNVLRKLTEYAMYGLWAFYISYGLLFVICRFILENNNLLYSLSSYLSIPFVIICFTYMSFSFSIILHDILIKKYEKKMEKHRMRTEMR